MGHLLTLTLWTHSAHMAVCPHGWKEISHGPSQRKQLGPVTDSTSLSSLLLESPPDTETSGGVASLPVVGVVFSTEALATLLLESDIACTVNIILLIITLALGKPVSGCVWGQEEDVWVDSLYNYLS